jgi:hypothetical protein
MAPAAIVAGGGLNLVYQFGGPAGWSVLFGAVSIAAPLLFNFVLFLLPIFGLISGARAIMRGRLIGGITGIVLNVIGGLITIAALWPTK